MINNVVLLKFLKFTIVGFLGIFVDFGITYLFKNKLKTHKYLANSLGFFLATINNYYLNKIWTFNDRSQNIISQFQKFLFISFIGLLLSNFIVYILNEKYKMNFWLSKLGAIVIVSLWNFFANYIYTFAQ